MAAARSAMMRLSRGSRFSSGSSAAAPTGGRVMGIPKPVHSAAARTPAVAKLEGWRRFSTAGREPTDKSVGVVRMLWQRCRNRYNDLDVYDKTKLSLGYGIVVLGGGVTLHIEGLKKMMAF